jgi:hypothetical protein
VVRRRLHQHLGCGGLALADRLGGIDGEQDGFVLRFVRTEQFLAERRMKY